MTDHDSNFPPDDQGVTVPMQPTPTPGGPGSSSRPTPTASSYAAELPLPEELQAMLGGGYVVEAFLGQGGMGAVYKGLQMPLRRPVAIKILAKRQAASGEEDAFEFEERFRREAYAMAALSHPNIVQVYDCGDAGEHYLYISMELVEGGDLSDAIKGGQMTPERALKLIPQICDGLQAAHDRGIVHRDIKPANIFLTADGRAKVADFGLAKKFDAQSTFATKTGMAMGTPDYAAPEQFDAVKDIDHRADVYSLGVMMYQMLTGTLPRGSFRPASQRAGTDPRLDAVLVKAMEHERDERYQSVAEIKADVLAITAGPAPAPKPVVTRAASAASATSVPVTRAQPQAAGTRSAVAQAAPRQASAAVATPAPQKKQKKSAVPWVVVLVMLAALGGGAMWFTGKRGGGRTSDARGNVAGTPQFTVSSEPWVDRMNDRAFTTKTSLVREGGSWRMTGLVGFQFDESMSDGAVRLLCSPGDDGTMPWVSLRVGGSNGSNSYRLGFGSTQPNLYLARDKQFTPLVRSVLQYPASVSREFFGHPIEIELRAVGSRITAKVNGELVASADDTTISNGICKIQLSAGTVIHGVQTLDLSKGAAAPAPLAAKGHGTELLPLVDVARDTIAGTWKRLGPGVELQTPTGFGILELPYEPPAEYDLEAEFTPTSGGNNVNFHVVAGGSAVIWKVNAHGRNPPIHGLDQLDGKMMTARTEAVVQKAPMLEQGQRYSTKVEVRRDGIRTFINGEEVLDWKGDFKRLGTEDKGNLRNPRALGIGSYKRGVLFHTVSVREIGGAASPAAPGVVGAAQTPPGGGASAPFPPQPKRAASGPIRLWGSAAEVPSDVPGVAWENGALHVVDSAIKEGKPASRDLVLRATVKGAPSPKSPAIRFRDQGAIGGAGGEYYKVLLAGPEGGVREVSFGYGPNTSPLRTWILPRFRSASEWMTVEVRAMGSAFTVSVDGQQLGTVVDNTLGKAGGVSFFAGDAYFRDVVYEPLDKLADPAAPATAPPLPGASGATKDAPFVNSLNMKFVPVPGTEVLMCIHETRRRDYAVYAAAVPGVDGTWKEPVVEKQPLKQTDDDPVVQVSWDDAHAFCEWLSKKEGRAYRLPTEREWNLAVATGVEDPAGITDDALRKVVGGQYPWGTTFTEKEAAKFANYVGQEDGYAGTAPVMSFQPNALGIYDLGGNTWEWEEGFFKPGDDQRALRGCGYRNYGGYQRSGVRERAPQDMRAAPDGDYTRRVPGFRVVVRAETAAAKAPAPAAGMPPLPGSGALSTGPGQATKEAPFVNSLNMKFVPVPITGGPTGGKRVLFSIWETRVQDYAEFSKEKQGKVGGTVKFTQGPTHPVVGVSWENANAYCAWLTARERSAGKIGARERYRLPSDLEWSCALGIGDREDASRSPSERNDIPSAMYLWGSAWPPPHGTGNLGGVELPVAKYSNLTKEVLSGYRDEFTETAPTGSYAANASGLHDLVGNAFEWCADEFKPGSGARVARGGAWASATRFYLAVNRRLSSPAGYQDITRGFRCVLDEE